MGIFLIFFFSLSLDCLSESGIDVLRRESCWVTFSPAPPSVVSADNPQPHWSRAFGNKSTQLPRELCLSEVLTAQLPKSYKLFSGVGGVVTRIHFAFHEQRPDPHFRLFFSVPLGNVSQNVNDNSIVLSVVIWFLINKPQQVLEIANGIEPSVTFSTLSIYHDTVGN